MKSKQEKVNGNKGNKSAYGTFTSKLRKEVHIPVRTIQDWETEKRNPPAYVVELLEFRVRYDIEQEQI
jgi:hypothetical protein